jgi:hypothetical protein
VSAMASLCDNFHDRRGISEGGRTASLTAAGTLAIAQVKISLKSSGFFAPVGALADFT